MTGTEDFKLIPTWRLKRAHRKMWRRWNYLVNIGSHLSAANAKAPLELLAQAIERRQSTHSRPEEDR